MNITIDTKYIDKIKANIKDIENWKGEAYQNHDEVDIAVKNIKTALSIMIHGKSTEVCPHCDNEIEIEESWQECPECGKPLVGCSLCCNHNKCSECPDGTDEMYDISLEEI